MNAGTRLAFGLSALAVLTTIGVLLHGLDMPAARFVRSFDIEAVNYSGDLVATLGRGVVLAGAFLLVGLLGWGLRRERLRQVGLRGLVAMAAVGGLSQLLKHLVGRPRPRFAHADEFALGPSLDTGLDSFPSGHTINAFGAAAVIAWFAPALRAPAYALAGLIGLSRVVRGSHFPTDVYAGAVLGVLIGTLAAAGFKRWREEALPGLLRTGVPLVAALFVVLWVVLHPARPWTAEIGLVGAGSALVLAGALLRRLAVRRGDGQGGPLCSAGNATLMLGVAVAVGPLWAGPLLLVALLPMGAGWPGRPAPDRRALPSWGRDALAVGSALTAIAALRSLQGLIPIG